MLPNARLPAALCPQVKYKNVMKHYNLGPNGGILTSCNLFATRFDQVRYLHDAQQAPPAGVGRARRHRALCLTCLTPHEAN